jgi:hypothetical protein
VRNITTRKEKVSKLSGGVNRQEFARTSALV